MRTDASERARARCGCAAGQSSSSRCTRRTSHSGRVSGASVRRWQPRLSGAGRRPRRPAGWRPCAGRSSRPRPGPAGGRPAGGGRRRARRPAARVRAPSRSTPASRVVAAVIAGRAAGSIAPPDDGRGRPARPRVGQVDGEQRGAPAGGDEALGDRVRRQPVGALDAGARDLADGEQARRRVVRPSRSASTPPQRVVRGRARPAPARASGRTRRRGRRGRCRGSGGRGSRRPGAVASSKTWSSPVARRWAAIVAETTSRGARSASGCAPAMIRRPSRSTSTAPSPRTASEISAC